MQHATSSLATCTACRSVYVISLKVSYMRQEYPSTKRVTVGHWQLRSTTDCHLRFNSQQFWYTKPVFLNLCETAAR